MNVIKLGMWRTAFICVTLTSGEVRHIRLIAEPRVVADHDTKLLGWRIVGGVCRMALARDTVDRAIVCTVALDPARMKP